MEASPERAVASLDMSQAETEQDEPFNGGGDYESLPPHVSVMTHMTAGAVAGVLEHTVMYPVDSVKVTASGCLAPRSRGTSARRQLLPAASAELRG